MINCRITSFNSKPVQASAIATSKPAEDGREKYARTRSDMQSCKFKTALYKNRKSRFMHNRAHFMQLCTLKIRAYARAPHGANPNCAQNIPGRAKSALA
jgi:hypothetical protein